MNRRLLLVAMVLMTALSVSACGDNGSGAFKTDNLKEYVQKSKQNSKWTPEKRKKVLKEMFPK